MKPFKCTFDGPPENGANFIQACSKVKESKTVALGFAAGDKAPLSGPPSAARKRVFNHRVYQRGHPSLTDWGCRIYDQEQTSQRGKENSSYQLGKVCLSTRALPGCVKRSGLRWAPWGVASVADGGALPFANSHGGKEAP